jgi:hypothetical protein
MGDSLKATQSVGSSNQEICGEDCADFGTQDMDGLLEAFRPSSQYEDLEFDAELSALLSNWAMCDFNSSPADTNGDEILIVECSE